MRVALRADAGFRDGTGHVMRVLTLAEALQGRGHEPHLVGADIDVPWLARQVADAGIPVHRVPRATLAADVIAGLDADRVVVDSYTIPADDIGSLDARIPVLAVIDGDTRGIPASLYLDQNLGADERPPAVDPRRMLRGSSFALIRRDILVQRRRDPWRLPAIPRIVAFLGGTDPTGGSEAVAAALAGLGSLARTTMIVPDAQAAGVRAALGPGGEVLGPTTELPALLGSADVIVSAAGSSAWEACALAIPSVFIAVVDNQQESLGAAVAHGAALGIDATTEPTAITARLEGMVRQLIEDEALRRSLSDAAGRAFDGRGAERVADALEKAGDAS